MLAAFSFDDRAQFFLFRMREESLCANYSTNPKLLLYGKWPKRIDDASWMAIPEEARRYRS
jgi:hypothetical protein